MKRQVAILLLLITTAVFVGYKADEGMFPLSDLGSINLQQAGLKISPTDLYNPNGISQVDAIVRVGGCTGSFVSADGLIVTNHHCAFGFVQAISNTQNNYIKNGFLAQDRSGEVPAKGLVCKITASYKDVSAQVLKGTEQIADPLVRMQLISNQIKKITTEENKLNPSLQCEISEMFTGKSYVLFRYKLLKDIRLVYVPPRSIGDYGGERDNWMWPRHSGDFAFLRAYVAVDGSAAEYNQNNIPFKPAKYLEVNPKGVKENDFVFILGYPGRTYRNQPAAFYKYHEQYMLDYVSKLYDWQIAQMTQMAGNNDSLRIRYAAKVKSLANTAKNFKGKLQGFRRVGLSAQKAEEEQRLQAFIQADPVMKQMYGDVIKNINQQYDEIIKLAPRNLFFDYLFSAIPAYQFSSIVAATKSQYLQLKTKQEKAAFLVQQIPRLKSNFQRLHALMDPTLESATMLKMLNDAKQFDSINQVPAVMNWFKQHKEKEDQDKTVAKWFNHSKINDAAFMMELLKDSSAAIFSLKEPLFDFAGTVNPQMIACDEQDKVRESLLNLLLSKYAVMKSAFQNKKFIPDANGTLRFTYGYVRGYHPNDGEYNSPFTTLKGVIEKADGKDYELLALVQSLAEAKDFGGFMHPDLQDLPVDFLYNLDTTGGNSGSPVMDDNGKLVGINFDRAFTATINDYGWNEAYSRSIAVDIRYVLWVVKKVAGAPWLLDEMGVKTQ